MTDYRVAAGESQEDQVTAAIEQYTSKAPSSAFLALAIGAIAGSLVFQAAKKEHAALWINQAIQRDLADSGRTIRLPVHVAQRSRKVGRVERELSVRLGREPTLEELAQESGLPIEQVEEVRHQRAALVSLDQQIGEDGDTALGDLLPSDAEAPEETAWDNERERIVHRAISELPETERTVLTLRFGTGREEPQTLTAIGKRLGFSAERASQLEQRALKKLAESPELAALREAA